jgi:multidrug efflux pump subunit AcrB
MNLAQFSIKNKLLIYVLTILCVAYGAIVFDKMGKLQDPEFTIKDALVITNYPGASALEVEKEITDVLEDTVQKLPYVKEIESINSSGQSILKVTMKDKYKGSDLQQIWDELRKKIVENSYKLPPRTQTTFVNDDFGDVYGIFLSVYGSEYTYDELKDYVDFLKKELILIEGVGKVAIHAEQERALFIEINREKLATLNVTKGEIEQALTARNLVSNFGSVNVGKEFISIKSDSINHIENLGNIVIKGTTSNAQIFLKDIATIKDSYKAPSSKILHYDGHNAIGLGISTVKGGNVVAMGAKVDAKLKALESSKPLGIEIGVISHQANDVDDAISSFMINLIEAVAIVIVVLLLFMGLRSGLIIGFVLFVTIASSFIFMPSLGILLERISLGALVIALGMLVDNAIVVVDGILVRINKGKDSTEAAIEVVKQTAMPLFAATLIAILAFAAIGLSQDSTGEFTQSLFYVVMISLGLSWVTAMTLTPLLAIKFLKPEKNAQQNQGEQGIVYKTYGNILQWCMNHRYATLGAAAGVLLVSLYSFQFVKQNFFPDSSRPQVMIDYFLPQGTSIDANEAYMKNLQKQIKQMQGVEHISTFVGSGALRFLLTYNPENDNKSYSFMLIDVDDYKKSNAIIEEVEALVKTQYPDINAFGRKFILGPAEGGKVQAKIFGRDLNKLREYEEEALKIFREASYAKGVRSDWRNRVKVIKPIISYEKANLNGISRDDIANAILDTFEGRSIGVYREENQLIPIILRSPQTEREDVKNLESIQIYSNSLNKMIPLKQLITSYEKVFEDDIIYEYNRKRAITIHADPILGKYGNDVLAQVKAKIENIDFDEGYYIEWHGEYKDSIDSQAPIIASLPFVVILMVLIIMALFNSVKKTLVIWLTVPFILIGVVWGLLIMDTPFGFMSLLGFLSLSGMLIKNAIVLVDEIILENEIEKKPLSIAIYNSGISRLRAVSMAALTTALGMIPLLFDVFFVSMAVVIIFGLVVSTVLTMILVPVYYSVLYKSEKLDLRKVNEHA